MLHDPWHEAPPTAAQSRAGCVQLGLSRGDARSPGLLTGTLGGQLKDQCWKMSSLSQESIWTWPPFSRRHRPLLGFFIRPSWRGGEEKLSPAGTLAHLQGFYGQCLASYIATYKLYANGRLACHSNRHHLLINVPWRAFCLQRQHSHSQMEMNKHISLGSISFHLTRIWNKTCTIHYSCCTVFTSCILSNLCSQMLSTPKSC